MASEHIYKQYDSDLEAIRAKVLEMGTLVEEQTSNAIQSLLDTDVKLALTALDALETRERYLDFEAIIQGDRYTFVKDAYIQSRNYEIYDGESDEDDFLEDLDDFLIED